MIKYKLRSIDMIRQQNGETLIEVMVASIVLSIGILGCMALQTKSVIFNQGSLNYTLATNTVSSITATLRSDYRSKVFNSADFENMIELPITAIDVLPDGGATRYDITVTYQDRAVERQITMGLYVGTPRRAVLLAWNNAL